MKLSLIGWAFAICGFGADWNKQLASDYLDASQKAWFEWRANGLQETIGNRLHHEKPGRMFPSQVKEPAASQSAAVDTVVSAFSMSIASSSSGAFTKALDRMLATQIGEGNSRGGWAWFHFGASLAAKALDAAPNSYRERPDVRERIADLEGYLKREFGSQPLHHRLFLIWVYWKSRGNVSDADGGDCYATAIASLAPQRVNRSAAKRGVAWLESHQDPATGAWLSKSMNKKFPPDSIMAQCMNEVANSYSVLALLATENS